MYRTLILTLLLLPLPLTAESYLFSGGSRNVAMTIASEVLIKAYSNAGIDIEPVFLNLEESLQQSNAGITDGELARIEKISDIYQNLMQVPVSIVSVEAVAFSKKPSLLIDKWEDLRDHKVVIIKGAKFIETATEHLPVQKALSAQGAFDRLNKGLVDIVVLPKLAGWSIIHRKKYKNIRMVSASLKKMKLYHFVHKKNRHLIPVITPHLKEMEKTGEISYIRNTQLRRLSKTF
ncbi:MAG: hypothetical protein DIZ80_01010 [endosymbiont of Galathealinum brachiosum]|uniref:Uncharacterized protein n=1 Tax=endosymbiont of Galathealinum brachiosum TaxID=2200906 RepID=A0A370DME9_9GAMM|nr:MAG: hypothetical protein DIZ80_01010 [endosymbiont of Galathealinum brachiosum]